MPEFLRLFLLHSLLDDARVNDLEYFVHPIGKVNQNRTPNEQGVRNSFYLES